MPNSGNQQAITDHEIIEQYREALEVFKPEVDQRMKDVLTKSDRPDTFANRIRLLFAIIEEQTAEIAKLKNLNSKCLEKLLAFGGAPQILRIETKNDDAGAGVNSILLSTQHYHCKLVWNAELGGWRCQQDNGVELTFTQFVEEERNENLPHEAVHMFNAAGHLLRLLDARSSNAVEVVTKIIDDSKHMLGELAN